MDKYALVIVGGGASGLLAGITALENGIKKVLIIDREEQLGGNLNLFIHNGFGEKILNMKLTGPEYATILSKKFYELGGESKLTTEVINIDDHRIVTYIDANCGMEEIFGDKVLIATGCRDKFTGNVVGSSDKFTGIYTVATAHKLINFDGYLPGKKIVISAKGKWAFLLARRLVVEGAIVKGIIDMSDNQDLDKYNNIIEPFDIELIQNVTISEIIGESHINGVVIDNYKDNSKQIISCDSIVLSVAYSPNINIIKSIESYLKDNISYPVVENFKTSVDGIYACGTVVYGEEIFENSDSEGKKAGLELIKDF